MQLANNFAKNICNEIIECFYPIVCSVCGNRNVKENSPIKEICGNCLSQIPLRDKLSNEVICLEKHTAAYDKYYCEANTKVLVACDYVGLVKRSLLYLKFYESEYYARFLAQIVCFVFANQINDFDYIIPIPLHKKRLNERGYNQSLLIAHEISKIADVEVLEDLLVRVEYTKRQSELSSKESRMQNLSCAFGINKEYNLYGKKIIVLDDVLTSGATMYYALKKLNDYSINNISLKGLVVASNRN